ncbi:alpha/beta hydrolase [Paracoccus laeviglucosivorans]|uniref:Acyl-CoA:diacylglycerol acyltransferase n=1 Tax=Paracoccus laeviglucosivorans TaxID=1197861 RepID=A0A521EBZ1_9RHOB|nr:alpha/beta hydrolase-fold protein [Paracoccus laeviglucosivorans]SMO81435.1 hypothetical protein SAMN06265221_11275 [Paracoccus laeviglucosivorans]
MTYPLSRRGLLAALPLVLATGALAQEQRRRPGDGPAEIIDDPRATTFQIGPSAAPWEILVGMPSVPAPPQGYSAIIAVDGNATFPIFWHHRQMLAPDAPVVLVGVGYPGGHRFDTDRRWNDLTSTAMQPVVPTGERLRGPGDRPTGGREALLMMIERQLLPELGGRVALNADDLTLYGHSLGGLFVLHALFTRPRLFRHFAAADPSTWWNSGEAMREAVAFAGGIAAAGGQLAQPTDLLIARSGGKRRGDTNPQPETPEIVTALSGIGGLRVTYRPHPDESHGSLIAPSAAEAMRQHLGMPQG